ncbi:MAG: winged helix-turn-helix domain-containing protein [Myxococcota bacterium]
MAGVGDLPLRPFELDLGAHRLSRAGAAIEVQPKAMELLAVLVRAPERVHARAELSDALWPDVAVSEHSLRQVLYKLREALGDHADVVRTVPRVGMQLAAPVQRVDAPTEPAAPGRLPAEIGAFVGRRTELAALDAAPAALRTLVGPGGVGKTRLAVRYARTRTADGPASLRPRRGPGRRRPRAHRRGGARRAAPRRRVGAGRARAGRAGAVPGRASTTSSRCARRRDRRRAVAGAGAAGAVPRDLAGGARGARRARRGGRSAAGGRRRRAAAARASSAAIARCSGGWSTCSTARRSPSSWPRGWRATTHWRC